MNKRNTKQENVKKAPVRGIFENPMNQECWICEDVNDTRTIDSVEFLQVHRPENMRIVLMRKDALKRVKK